MARRRRKEQVDPAQALTGMLMLGAFFGMYKLTNSFVGGSIAAGCVLGAYISIVMIVNQKHTERLKRSGIADIDKMDGRTFELYLGHLFRSHGYETEVTQAAGDYGADLVIKKGGQKIVVQAKRYSKNVGLKAVQEAHTAMNHYGASEAWVVTNRDYTEQAYTLAKSNGVRLIKREQLIEMILAVNPGQSSGSKTTAKDDQVSTSAVPVAAADEEPDDLECPKCGYLLVKRNGKRGEFYGCSNFPKCRHTRTIDEFAESV
ncbi:restriction endonuclease [Paenibacillus sp. PL2-23]|uniref:restriction endonuclease n=1 Tax=Paenibacillus sp. PL2-23 TaxID=2100729 RepID=UPI0030F666A8